MFPRRLVTAIALLGVVFTQRWCEGAQSYALYQSLDGGMTWRETAHPFKANRINALHAEGDRVWVGSEHGLFVSRDSGKSWSDLDHGRLGNVKAMANTRDVMVVGTKTGLWRAQKGSDWSQVAELGVQYIRSVATDGSRFFAGTDRGEVYISEDKGTTWKSASAGLPPHAQVFELKTNASGQLFAGLYSLGFYTLRDGAWENSGAPFGFTILPIDSTLVVGGNPGGIVRSEDGGKSWILANGLAARAPTWTLFMSGQNLFVGTSGKCGLFRSNDLGKNWAPIGEKEFGGKSVVAMAAVGNVLLAATVNNAVVESFDPGKIAGISD